MRYLLVFSLLFFQQLSANAPFWGKTGHRVVGEVAEQHLKNSTKRKIMKLLDGQSLALVSNYGDDIKSDPKYKEYSAWHYVNFPFDKAYGEETPSEYGDIIIGIDKCIAVLKDDNAKKEDKVFYLKLLVHFMGDLHQPLHVGRGEDKGGNDIQVRWFNEGSNLHRVWDSDMIDFYGMSYTELANNLPVYSKTQEKSIAEGSILDWVEESQELAKKVYASANTGEKLGYRYMYDYFDTVRAQLEKGGLRLAKVLNDIF
ncbi:MULTISPECIES: S1/P1 nuclease [Galbibacter]|uniref:S1/P1 nuclease n=1 Tax=Galbibacter pacificus TaxID=2996052 RepID=A0ABT6FVJ8_9FLAO|nr:S1/P1 nuclease [Galbibacter pacificus]MDG3583784.1 S1/P1 nuclease [Galbibacter pacificus]MDG3587298.1 S1/P1 nuclease [Galbibacter pacificus]